MGKLVAPYRLLDAKTHVAYTEYTKRKRSIPTIHIAEGREEMRKILKTICKHIAEGMIEKQGGVYIKRLGYFFNWMPPRKMTYHIKIKGGHLEEHYNYHTNHYMYFPTFIPMAAKLETRVSWTMDKQFNHVIRRRCAEKIRAGFKYKNYSHSIKSA